MFIIFFKLRWLFLLVILSSLTRRKGSYLSLQSLYQYSNLTNVTETVLNFFFTYMSYCKKIGGEFLSLGVKSVSKTPVLADGHGREANIS